MDYMAIAQRNIDANLGCVCDGDDPIEVIREEAFTLAFDAAIDAGATQAEATEVANTLSAHFS